MTAIAQHAAPRTVEDPHAVQRNLRTAEFSVDPQVLDDLARGEVTGEVLRKIAHNPATSEDTLEHLIELDQRWLTYPVTRRTDLSAEFVDRIARRLIDRNAIFHACSAPCAAPETLRYLAELPAAPPATIETVTERIGALTLVIT